MIASVLKSLEKPFIQGSVILNWLVDTRSEIEEFLRRQTAGTPDSQEVIYQTVVFILVVRGCDPQRNGDSCPGLVFAFFSLFCDFCDFSQNSQFSQKSLKSQKSQRVWETLSSLAFESFAIFAIFRNFRKFRKNR